MNNIKSGKLIITLVYNLSLQGIVKILIFASKELRVTNNLLNTLYKKSQQSYRSLTLEQSINVILRKEILTDTSMLYPIYGEQRITIKSSINKREDMIAHLSIMVTNLYHQLKNNPGVKIEYKTEEELFLSFLGIFHKKLFESPLFRKICNEIWRVSLVFCENIKQMGRLLREHLDLYNQGISEVSIHPANYLLHKAVFENNLPLIRRLCAGERLFK